MRETFLCFTSIYEKQQGKWQEAINSYYNWQTTNQLDTGKGIPRSTAQMMSGVPTAFILINSLSPLGV